MSSNLGALLRDAEGGARRPDVRPIRLSDLEVLGRRRSIRRAALGAIIAASLAAGVALSNLRTVAPAPEPPIDWSDLFARTDAALATTEIDDVERARIRALEAVRVRSLIATARLDTR